MFGEVREYSRAHLLLNVSVPVVGISVWRAVMFVVWVACCGLFQSRLSGLVFGEQRMAQASAWRRAVSVPVVGISVWRENRINQPGSIIHVSVPVVGISVWRERPALPGRYRLQSFQSRLSGLVFGEPSKPDC